MLDLNEEQYVAVVKQFQRLLANPELAHIATLFNLDDIDVLKNALKGASLLRILFEDFRPLGKIGIVFPEERMLLGHYSALSATTSLSILVRVNSVSQMAICFKKTHTTEKLDSSGWPAEMLIFSLLDFVENQPGFTNRPLIVHNDQFDPEGTTQFMMRPEIEQFNWSRHFQAMCWQYMDTNKRGHWTGAKPLGDTALEIEYPATVH